MTQKKVSKEISTWRIYAISQQPIAAGISWNPDLLQTFWRRPNCWLVRGSHSLSQKKKNTPPWTNPSTRHQQVVVKVELTPASTDTSSINLLLPPVQQSLAPNLSKGNNPISQNNQKRSLPKATYYKKFPPAKPGWWARDGDHCNW